jgi:hypothetical protein
MARGGSVALIAVAVVAGVAAVAAGPDLTAATAAALVALAAAAGAAALGLRPTRTPRPAPVAPPESDSLILLREAFRSGALGRRAILSTLRGLERDLGGDIRPPPSLDQERALMDAPPERFRAWVDERLDALEASA